MSDQVFAVPIDCEELAVIILENITGMNRPEGLTFRQALDSMPSRERSAAISAAESAILFVVAKLAEGGVDAKAVSGRVTL